MQPKALLRIFRHLGGGRLLQKTVEYRVHAAECRALAKETNDPYLRDTLLQVAEAWEGLALSREQLVTNRKKWKIE